MNYTPTLQTVRVRMADKKALFTHGEVQLVFDALAASEQRGRVHPLCEDGINYWFQAAERARKQRDELEAKLQASERALERVREAWTHRDNWGRVDAFLAHMDALLASPGSPQEKGK